MHIGIDGRLPFYQRGGISQYVLNLLSALVALDRENKYTVFHSRKDTENYAPESAPNFYRGTLWTPCHHRLERWSLAAEILPRRVDLLHSPDFIPPAFGAKWRIITVHDLNFLYYPEFLSPESRRYYNDQIDWAVNSADMISADSCHTRNDLINRLNVNPDKVVTIHLAANSVYSQDHEVAAIKQTLERFGLPKGYLLYVGSLTARKNIQTLLLAYSMVRSESAIDIPLVLAGRKGWQHELIFKQIKELGLTDMVKHIPDTSEIELAHIYSEAGLLALPSFYEGFGLPPLEAMHCGCPVIVSDRASLPEVVGSAGILIDPSDTEAWAEAIITVLTDSRKRAEMIGSGYREAERFSWDKTAADTLQLYRHVSAGSG